LRAVWLLPAALAMAGPMKLFVGCLPYSKTEAEIGALFAQFGQINEVAVMRNGDGTPKGAAFVTFEYPQQAANAMLYLRDYVFPGSTRGINVSIASSSGQGKGYSKMQMSPPPPPPMTPGPPQTPYLPSPSDIPAQLQSLYAPVPSEKSAGQAESGTKIFVGQLPYSKSEPDVFELFSSVGPVEEVTLLRTDKRKQERRGAAFVRYAHPLHAATAITKLDGYMFEGSTRHITVSYAKGSDDGQATRSQQVQSPLLPPLQTQLLESHPHPKQRSIPVKRQLSEQEPVQPGGVPDGTKLFVGQLPFSRNEEDLKEVFGNYGPVTDVLLHRDMQGQKKGGAFVKFASEDGAEKALALDGYLFQGSTRPITVSFAGTQAPKRPRLK